MQNKQILFTGVHKAEFLQTDLKDTLDPKDVLVRMEYTVVSGGTERANILAIMSFTLNRVYTEFYRNQGYDFTITSSTAFDHKFVYGRNIFDTISQIVDEMFGSYLARPGIKQPILPQYCDGARVTCPNWMTQWGSQDLGKRGYSASEILRYYYGDSIYIATAEEVSGVPSSFLISVGRMAAPWPYSMPSKPLKVMFLAFMAIPSILKGSVLVPRNTVPSLLPSLPLPVTTRYPVPAALWKKYS